MHLLRSIQTSRKYCVFRRTLLRQKPPRNYSRMYMICSPTISGNWRAASQHWPARFLSPGCRRFCRLRPLFTFFPPRDSQGISPSDCLVSFVVVPSDLVGLRRGDIARLPMWLQPTLLLEEPDPRPEMQMILQSSTYRGARIVSSHGLFEFYGPEIIFSHNLQAERRFKMTL